MTFQVKLLMKDIFFYKWKRINETFRISHTNLTNKKNHDSRPILLLSWYYYHLFLLLPLSLPKHLYFFCYSVLVSPDQRDALLELQKEFPIHTYEAHNVTASSWDSSVECCYWDGVTCDTNLGVVISLFIHSYTTVNTNLKSSSALLKLQHLTELDLSYCSLQGVIPSSIGNLSHLTVLDLARNHLVGEIPTSLANLNQLEFMDLSDNDISGNIPTSFANLTKLSTLYLEGNQFTGGLDLVLSNLTSLSRLDLSSNQFPSSIFPYLTRLHNLVDFSGSDNSFGGSFPTSLLKISSLVNLGLSHNNFGGQIPKSIWVLHNLEGLDLSYNNFGGQVPKSISKLVNLGTLDLSYNKLDSQIPHCLFRSSKLFSLHLSHNSFNSFGDSVEVINGASLHVLDLASNSFQGPFPQWICKLRFLSSLDLSNNRFTGSIPGCLSHLDQSLKLRNNNLSGFIPDLCIDGAELQSLDLSRNNLVGKLPKSLINCTRMEFLNVKGNKIKDTFPFWLGSLQDLRVLVLGTNAFYGPVYNPSAYLGFPGLRIIDISNNNFVGSLPQDYFASWFEMSEVWSGDDYDQYLNEDVYVSFNYRNYESIDLVYKGVDTDFARIFQAFKAIDFSGNRFSGKIPKSIGLLSDLRLLNFSGNTFIGNIPPSLANIPKLEILDLSQNNLSGEIPQGLGKLTFLSNINFSYNHLEGLVPQSTQFDSQNCSSFVGNPELHGFEEICGKIQHVPIPTSQQPEESLSEPKEKKVNWIAAAIAFGPGVFCGIVIGHIFTSYKHEWLRTKLF